MMSIRIKTSEIVDRLSHIHSLMRTRYGRHCTKIHIHGKKNATISCKKILRACLGALQLHLRGQRSRTKRQLSALPAGAEAFFVYGNGATISSFGIWLTRKSTRTWSLRWPNTHFGGAWVGSCSPCTVEKRRFIYLSKMNWGPDENYF